MTKKKIKIKKMSGTGLDRKTTTDATGGVSCGRAVGLAPNRRNNKNGGENNRTRIHQKWTRGGTSGGDRVW
jgi:hypothetical protein